MQETEFHELVDHLYLQLEDIIDDSGADIDFETSAGVMTLTCEESGSKIILSRQPANNEIWVAAKSGGFHFSCQGSDWVCATGESLQQLLARVIHEQSGESLVIEFA